MGEELWEIGTTESALTITLGDFLAFITWMNVSQKAFEQGSPLPDAPKTDSGRMKAWVTLIRNLEQRQQASEEKHQRLESNLQHQEIELGEVLSNLHGNIASLYENLGQMDKANAARKRAELLHPS